MKFFNATQAARRIGISDKTIRRWISNGQIAFVRTAGGQIAIADSEVEKKRVERAQFFTIETGEDAETSHVLAGLAARIEALETEVSELHKRLNERTVEHPQRLPHNSHTTATQSSLDRTQITYEAMSDGTMSMQDFAERYGVPRSTMMHHIKVGIAGECIETTQRPRPGRPGQTQHFLTQDQQSQAVAFWRRNGVKYEWNEKPR